MLRLLNLKIGFMSDKKKLGRPLGSPLPRQECVTVRFNSVELDALTIYADRYDMNISSVIRDALMILSVIPDNPLNDHHHNVNKLK